MMKEIKEINRKIWYGIGAFIIICFVIVGISFKINTDAKETQIKQEEEPAAAPSKASLIATLNPIKGPTK